MSRVLGFELIKLRLIQPTMKLKIYINFILYLILLMKLYLAFAFKVLAYNFQKFINSILVFIKIIA